MRLFSALLANSLNSLFWPSNLPPLYLLTKIPNRSIISDESFRINNSKQGDFIVKMHQLFGLVCGVILMAVAAAQFVMMTNDATATPEQVTTHFLRFLACLVPATGFLLFSWPNASQKEMLDHKAEHLEAAIRGTPLGFSWISIVICIGIGIWGYQAATHWSGTWQPWIGVIIATLAAGRGLYLLGMPLWQRFKVMDEEEFRKNFPAASKPQP